MPARDRLEPEKVPGLTFADDINFGLGDQERREVKGFTKTC